MDSLEQQEKKPLDHRVHLSLLNYLPLKARFPLQMTLNHIYLNCASWLQHVLKCL